MNLFNGKVVRKGDGLAFSGKAVEFFLPAALGKAVRMKKIALNENVSLGVRLEDTCLSGRQEPGNIQVQGEIIGLETRASDTLVTARVGDEKVRVIASAKFPLRFGQIVSIAFSLSSVFLV